MIISIIVAMDKHGLIGRENDLPWRLSSDLKHFKSITMGKPIVMGRKTHESIGRALPGRENIILTRNEDYLAQGCTVVNRIEDLESLCESNKEIMIIGGAELYRAVYPHAKKFYLTEVHAELAGDTYFKEFQRQDWLEISREDFSADENNDYDYSFVEYERKR